MADKQGPSDDVQDEVQESLDELNRLSESLIDGLASGDEQTEPTQDRAAELRETLRELDRLGGPEDPRAANEILIAAGQDRGLDIDDCLDALFDGETAAPAPPVETAPEVEQDESPAPEPIVVESSEIAAAVPDPPEERAILPGSLFDLPAPVDLEPPRERKGSAARVAFLAVLLLAVAAATWLLIPRGTSVEHDAGELDVPRAPVPAAVQPQPPALTPTEPAVGAPAAAMPAIPRSVPVAVAPAPAAKAPPSPKRKKSESAPPSEAPRARAKPPAPAPEISAPDPPEKFSAPPVEAAAVPQSVSPVAEPQVEAPRIEAPRIEAPQVVTRVEPTYPAHARARDQRGMVVLSVLVNERGQVVRVVVENGIPNSDLDAAAIDAVLRWRYRPGTENGRPVRAWVTETFTFGP